MTFISINLLMFLCWSVQKATLTNDTKDKEYTPHDLPQRQSVQPQETCSIARRAKRMRSEVSHLCCFTIVSLCQLCGNVCPNFCIVTMVGIVPHKPSNDFSLLHPSVYDCMYPTEKLFQK